MVAMKMVTIGPHVTTCLYADLHVRVLRPSAVGPLPSEALHEAQWRHQSLSGKCVLSRADRFSGVGSAGFHTTRADRSSTGNSSSIFSSTSCPSSAPSVGATIAGFTDVSKRRASGNQKCPFCRFMLSLSTAGSTCSKDR